MHRGSVRLEGDIIRKSYKLENPKHAETFAREMQILDRLRGTDFAPQLIYVDVERGELYHTDPGRAVSPIEMLWAGADINRQRAEIMHLLETKFKIVRASRLNPNVNTKRLPIRFLHKHPQTLKYTIDNLHDTRWKLLPL